MQRVSLEGRVRYNKMLDLSVVFFKFELLSLYSTCSIIICKLESKQCSVEGQDTRRKTKKREREKMNCLPCTPNSISEEDELKALDRFLQCQEELPSLPPLPPPPPATSVEGKEEEEDITDEERQKRFFQQQMARLKQQKQSSPSSLSLSAMPTDPLAGHSFIQMIKAKFQVSVSTLLPSYYDSLFLSHRIRF